MPGQSGEPETSCDSGRRPRKGRAPFQVLVLPFFVQAGTPQYAIFRRADAGYWQFVAGGGENDEQPVQAAVRECLEEAGTATAQFFPLQSTASLSVVDVTGDLRWGPGVLAIPEYSFGVEVAQTDLRISREHTEYRWTDYETARAMLRWESNRNALLELKQRIAMGGE